MECEVVAVPQILRCICADGVFNDDAGHVAGANPQRQKRERDHEREPSCAVHRRPIETGGWDPIRRSTFSREFRGVTWWPILWIACRSVVSNSGIISENDRNADLT